MCNIYFKILLLKLSCRNKFTNLQIYSQSSPNKYILKWEFPRKLHNIMLLKKISIDNSKKPATELKSQYSPMKRQNENVLSPGR